MTAKRMKKLYMAQGVPRDTAEFISKHLRMKDGEGRTLSHKEFYESVSVKTERIKNGSRSSLESTDS